MMRFTASTARFMAAAIASVMTATKRTQHSQQRNQSKQATHWMSSFVQARVRAKRAEWLSLPMAQRKPLPDWFLLNQLPGVDDDLDTSMTRRLQDAGRR